MTETVVVAASNSIDNIETMKFWISAVARACPGACTSSQSSVTGVGVVVAIVGKLSHEGVALFV